MLNAKAAAWTAYLDTHAVLLPDFKERVRVLKARYRVAQIGFLILLADSHFIAHATGKATEVTSPVYLATFVLFGLFGWLGIKAMSLLHAAWYSARWGYAASSLQRIYKNHRDNVLPSGTLTCINCRNEVWKQGEGVGRENIDAGKVQRGACQCQSCGFQGWPGCSRLSALFQNLDSHL